VSTAILAAQIKDEAQFKHLAVVTEALDANATHVIAVMNGFAATKYAEIKVLQNSSTATKADIAALRKEVKRKPKAADVKKQEKKLQEFLDAAIKKAKESANPIALVGELEGLAYSVKEGRSVKEAASLREEPSVKKGKIIDSDQERPIRPIEPDSGEGPAAPPLRPFRLELYDPDEDGEEEGDRAAGGVGGGGGGRRTGGVGGGASPPGSSSDTLSDKGSPSPPPSQPLRWSATPQRNSRVPSPRMGLWDRKQSPSPHKLRDPVRVTIEKSVLDKPEKFSSHNAKPTFAAWWARVGNYFKYYKTTYVMEMDKIAFVGHRMSGNTEEWYETRAAQLKQQNK